MLTANMLPAISQSPAFYHLSTAEGLSDNNVNAAARDRNGILWIGTTEGLNSFDGNRITTYNKYRYPALKENNIDKIFVDAGNNVWIRTNNDQVLMLDRSRTIKEISIPELKPGENLTNIFSTEAKGVIGLRGRQHFIKKHPDSTTMVKLKFEADSLIPLPLRNLFRINADRIGYYGNDRLIVIDYSTMKVIMKLNFPGLMSAVSAGDDEFIGYTLSGKVFYRFSISQNKMTRKYENIKDQYGLPIADNLRTMAHMGNNRFAVSTRFSGMYYIDLKNETAEHWPHDPLDRRSIGGNNPYYVTYDTSGYLFVTTQTSGLHYYNLKQQQAWSRSYFINKDREVFDGYIQSVLPAKNDIVWMGAQDRLIKWNKKTGISNYIPCYLPNGENIGEETIRSLQLDGKENLWVGTSRYGVLILDKQLKTIRRLADSIPGEKTRLPSNWINTMCRDNEGRIWVGTLRGTCMADEVNFNITELTNHPQLSVISKIPATTIWINPAGNIWFGTTKGAWYYNKKENTIKQFSTENGLIHNTILSIAEDGLGNTYLGTAQGLSLLLKDGTIKNFTRNNGLRNDRCEGILKDENGFIWIGNLNCILRYDPKSGKFAIYEEGLGFSHAGFRMRCCYTAEDGEMYWGSDKGLTWFRPGEMNNILLPLYPSINTLETEDSVYHFTSNDTLQFNHRTSSFAFYFSSGELSGGKKAQLLYRLSDFDEDWKSPAVNGLVSYNNLTPGSYRFEVKASQDGINWKEAGYPIIIQIKKPWWQQAWFKLLAVILAGGAIYSVYRYFKKRKEHQELMKKNKMELMEINMKMAESRFSNLRLQMNPHFLFNSLSSIQHLIVSQQTTKAYKYLTVFSNFLRTLLNFADKNFIPLDEELKILKMYVELESLRFDQSFSFDITVDESLANEEILLPTLMVQPFAENAIWHGLLHKEGDKKLSIRFNNSSEDFLTCTIEDNGIGRLSSSVIKKNNINSTLHKSKGIQIIEERLKLMQQKTGKPAYVEITDLYNGDKIANGTKVVITIPYYNPEEI